jgi:hypothetical protein
MISSIGKDQKGKMSRSCSLHHSILYVSESFGTKLRNKTKKNQTKTTRTACTVWREEERAVVLDQHVDVVQQWVLAADARKLQWDGQVDEFEWIQLRFQDTNQWERMETEKKKKNATSKMGNGKWYLSSMKTQARDWGMITFALKLTIYRYDWQTA